MAFKKKTWKDRMVEYAGRRKLTNISTNQSIICDVARSEGTVSQEGDALSSQNLNDLEQRIEDGFTEVKQTTDTLNQNLSQIQIYVGDDDKLHFIDKDGADTALNFTPKKTITVSTYINSWTWRCYAVTSINGKEVCRVETTNPGDTSTNSNTNTVSTTI